MKPIFMDHAVKFIRFPMVVLKFVKVSLLYRSAKINLKIDHTSPLSIFMGKSAILPANVDQFG